MAKRVEICFDNDHCLVLCDREDDISEELGHGMANRQNGAILFETDDGQYLVPIARILYARITEEDD